MTEMWGDCQTISKCQTSWRSPQNTLFILFSFEIDIFEKNENSLSLLVTSRASHELRLAFTPSACLTEKKYCGAASKSVLQCFIWHHTLILTGSSSHLLVNQPVRFGLNCSKQTPKAPKKCICITLQMKSSSKWDDYLGDLVGRRLCICICCHRLLVRTWNTNQDIQYWGLLNIIMTNGGSWYNSGKYSEQCSSVPWSLRGKRAWPSSLICRLRSIFCQMTFIRFSLCHDPPNILCLWTHSKWMRRQYYCQSKHGLRETLKSKNPTRASVFSNSHVSC